MYHVFQQQDENSAVIFSETCTTLEQVEESKATAPFSVLFIYDSETKSIEIINPHYTIDQIEEIIKATIGL